MGNQQLYTALWTFMICINHVSGKYRSVSVNNVDVCRVNKRSLGSLLTTSSNEIEIGEGAAILELKNPSKRLQSNYRNKLKECEIRIKAPEHFGIISYVEEMNMRLSSKDKDCIDYIQFGQNDMVPFYTMKKSKKMCGKKNGKTKASEGFFYDDPKGNLLIWIGLGGRGRGPDWNEISEVSLTLVVTAYKKRCSSKNRTVLTKDSYQEYGGIGGKFKECGDYSDECILKDYFCDRRFNCPLTSHQPNVTNDELSCNYKKLGLEDTTLSPDQGDDELGITFGNLNLISLTLIIICLLCVPLILCLAVLQIRKIYSTRRGCCNCFGRSLSERNSCELPEGGPQSLVQLSSQRQRHLNDTEQNVYLPLTTFLDQPISQENSNANEIRENDSSNNYSRVARRPTTTDFPEEPPPAYNDLFPDNFQRLDESPNPFTETTTLTEHRVTVNDGSVANHHVDSGAVGPFVVGQQDSINNMNEEALANNQGEEDLRTDGHPTIYNDSFSMHLGISSGTDVLDSRQKDKTIVNQPTEASVDNNSDTS